MLPPIVRLVEVGPRDGLQNEARLLPTGLKVDFIESLAAAGLKTIEVGSFVSPHAVPWMADTAEVLRSLHRFPSVTYTALVPNIKGLNAAIDAGVNEIAVFASASETFSQKNLHCSISQSLQRYREVCLLAFENSIRVRGYISCVIGCPYEGLIATEAVLQIARELIAMGCYEVSLGDTIGIGTAGQVETLLRRLLPHIPVSQLAVHFHDTRGQALANILVALQMGINVIDSAAAGLGGCPFAPGATGNVATEDLLYMLQGLRIETGVDLQQVSVAGLKVCTYLGRAPASRVSQALRRG